MTTCLRCAGPLYGCDRAVGAEVCVECVRKSLAPTEWAVFLKALRTSVRDDGTVHVNDVRPLIRGRIQPKRIGTFWRRARAEGLIAHLGWEDSTDRLGANNDKQARIWKWIAAEQRRAS